MSGFFEQFGTYSNFRSGQFSQELTQGSGTVTLGNSQNINVIAQQEQRAQRQVDTLAQAARTNTAPSQTRSTPRVSSNTTVIGDSPSSTTVVTTTTVTDPSSEQAPQQPQQPQQPQPQQVQANDDGEIDPFLPEGTMEEEAEIARLLQAERDAEAAKAVQSQPTQEDDEDDQSWWEDIIEFFFGK